MRLLIGTPAYNGMVHLDYVNSLLDYQKSGLDFTLASFGNESLITRARNTIISYFYHNQEQYTHLFFLDADIRLPAADLKFLLSFNKDVIGAAVPLKTYAANGKPVFNVGGFKEKVAEQLYTTARIGTAALLLSNKAAVDLVKQARAAGRIYKNNRGFDSSNALSKLDMFDVFQVGVVDNEYLSEDFWVCRELASLGYDIHVTDAVSVTHHGMHGFGASPR
ncbi:MAG: hypothetical protein O2971_12965 [Proteobacteria bacterium]|nr:hypothetical protein [Pseudomonadota bacterium]